MLLLLTALLLAACIDSNNNDPVLVVFPVNTLDFPLASQIYASDGADLDISGIAVATSSSSVVDQISLELDDASDSPPLVLPPLANDPAAAAFNWRQPSLAPEVLPLGLSSITATASFGESSNSASTLIARGSSWMWQAGLQRYEDNSTTPATVRWLLLDTARRGLIEIDLATGEHSDFSMPDDGNGVELRQPVDFAIDSDRALVVDRQLQAIVAIDLASGARTILSDAGTPTADPPLLQNPVAIAIDSANAVAYIAQRGDGNLLQISLADGARSSFAVLPEAEQPALLLPLDIVYQASQARLLVSDSSANAVIEIDTADGSSRVLLAPGDDEAAAEPEDVFYAQVNRLALMGDTLFVSDTGLFAAVDPATGLLAGLSGAIFKVDVSGTTNDPATDGDRSILSAGEPGFTNLFRSPQALAYDPRDAADPLDDRLLVLDNQLGVIVAVEAFETEGGTPEQPVSLGRRTYLPGGASLNQADLDSGDLTRALGLAADSTAVTLRAPVAALGLGSVMFVLDEAQNAVFTIDLQSGARSRLDQALGGSEGDTQEQQDAAQALFDSTRFDRATALQLDASGFGLLVVDVADDSVVSVPLTSATGGNATVRDIASQSDAALPLDDPRALAVFAETLADGASGPAQELLYVLNGNAIVQIDIADEADPAANRSAFFDVASSCGFINPAHMLLHINSDADGVTESAQLLVAEANAKTLHIIDRATGSCTSLPYTYDASDDAAIDIVDMQFADLTNSEPVRRLLLLDRGNAAVLSLTLDTALPSVEAAVVLSSKTQPPSGANQMVSALGLAFDAPSKRVFVLDEVLRSVYTIDVAERDPASGRRLTADELAQDNPPVPAEITGQRLVFSRGTSLNCQPASACAL